VSLPPRFARVLVEHGIAADTRLRIEDLYYSLGAGVMDALADLAEQLNVLPPEITPQHLERVRLIMGERFLARHHPEWLAGQGTRGFWQDRGMAGAVGGSIRSLGLLDEDGGPALVERVRAACGGVLAEGQPGPRGLLLLALDSHSAARPGTFTLEVVPRDLESAQVLNRCVGRQHSTPGSIGETSGTLMPDDGPAVVWEVQPNVYKPTSERNREARSVVGKHRSWPVVTTVAAFAWLRGEGRRVFVLRPEALRPAHEVNPRDEPLGDELLPLHERNVRAAADALGLELVAPAADFDATLLARAVSPRLERELHAKGAEALLWELMG
jgi:hypothetical protein